jgi:hypothetical protein
VKKTDRLKRIAAFKDFEDVLNRLKELEMGPYLYDSSLKKMVILSVYEDTPSYGAVIVDIEEE